MSLVLERSRRENAGSRMRFLIAKEVEMEALFEDNESDDEEFLTKVEDEPEDVLESDFDIDSSEGEAEHEDQAKQEDKNIENEERKARRPTLRHEQPRRNLQPKARPKAQQQQQQNEIASTSKVDTHRTHTLRKPREKVSLGDQALTPGIRYSSRMNTVLNRIQVEEQMRENELRKSLLPKRDRPSIKHLTQEELLAEATITEEKNLKALEQWQLMEADRRARTKKKDKKAIEGPLVRYHSFTDGKPEERPRLHKMILICSAEDGKNIQSEIVDPVAVAWQNKQDIDESEMVGRNSITFLRELPPKEEEDDDDDEDNSGGGDDEKENRRKRKKWINTSGLTDKELDRLDLIPELNSWLDKEPKPLKPATCLITGQPAIYRDPSTMVPFSNKETFGVIRACENHEMRWSPNLGVYLGRLTGATGVPDGWDQMIAGKAMGEPDWVNKNGNPARPSWMRAYGEPCPKKSLETKRTMDTKRHAGSPGPSTARRTRQRSHHTTPPPTDLITN
ncbi:YL1 nuclear protein-domain-containing protein [Phycomyces blakesleeanus]|uniref:YL1 nuclear protein-domain-containing protein n=1 Tax=Phycomyces blakesleeanus TaxID=4837 RepID=A0ABR3ARY7_PHYBL